MVAKISLGNSLYGALAYNQLKVDMGEARILDSNNMVENEEGELDIHSAMQSFEHHLSQNQRTHKPILHISLNPHPDDDLNDEQYIEIAQEYLKKMGYDKHPYIIYKHEDIDRHHLHIITTNVDMNGKKVKDGNNYYKNNKVCRELEDKYNLQSPTKAKKQDQSFFFHKVDITKDNVKMQIANVIKPLAATYKFQSFGEYRTLLSLYNICVEESKGVRNGKAYEGLIYYATNDRGEKISNPFKSSLFGKSVGLAAINSKCCKHKQTIKDRQLNKLTAKRIDDITSGINDKQTFKDSLKAGNIDVIFRENDAGRIYGVTFIDHDNNCVFNGSRLGKDYSANALNDRFNTSSYALPDYNVKQNEQYSEDSFSLGGILDLPADGADDSEEALFRKRMQRKGKKRHTL